MKILFIIPYPVGTAPSQRFRFEQYFKDLAESGHEVTVSPFMGPNTWSVLYKPGFYIFKTFGILKGYLRRTWDVLRAWQYDFIFIHREAAPLGPPLFEWIMAKCYRKKIIFDFDDAIWIPNSSEHNFFINRLKRYKNTRDIIKWSYKVSCGNPYLQDYARQFNKNAVFNPTVIDTTYYVPGKYSKKTTKFVIGWTGSHSTMQYLDSIVPLIRKLETEMVFEFHVISDKTPSFSCQSLRFRKWNKATEIEDLQQFDIGLMPLTDDKWAKGKCGFKALQYLALEIPAVVSPVGINSSIVSNGENGFLCSSIEEWESTIRKLYYDRELLNKIKKKTRKVIEEKFSVVAHRESFIAMFE